MVRYAAVLQAPARPVKESDKVPTDEPARIAERLDRIWKQKETEEQREISHRTLLQEMEDQLQVKPMSVTHLNNLRRGEATNPTFEVLCDLGRYFNVDPAYFVTPDEDLANLLLMHHHMEQDSQFTALMNMIKRLSPPAIELIRETSRFLLEHELYPPSIPGDGRDS